ncbi:hypothetical protein L6452_01873 [Arctium lappa]|uniref:Uncharacterized protein n=1 Tax=Arctium lappa TaxID=4217 RepID=A0ACB9FHW5_ARCLA|nr:hypothetical protein L6452_01873 [Arctium lappa]
MKVVVSGEVVGVVAIAGQTIFTLSIIWKQRQEVLRVHVSTLGSQATGYLNVRRSKTISVVQVLTMALKRGPICVLGENRKQMKNDRVVWLHDDDAIRSVVFPFYRYLL